MEDDYGDNQLPWFSTFETPAATTSNQEEIMELSWQNGNLAFQKPSLNIITTSPLVFGGGSGDAAIPAELLIIKEFNADGTQEQHNFFMQENEMGSWLDQYPGEDSSFNYEDLLSSLPPPIAPTPMTTVPEEFHDQLIPLPAQNPPESSPPILNFGNFLRNIPSSYNSSIDDSMSTPSLLKIAGNYTAGESSQHPLIVNESVVSVAAPPPALLTTTGNYTAGESSQLPLIAEEPIVSLASPPPPLPLPPPDNSLLAGVTCNLPASTSLGGTGPSLSGSDHTLPVTPKQDLPPLPPLPPPPAVVDRKQKGRVAEQNDCCQIEALKGMEIGGTDGRRKGECSPSTSTKRTRSRTAEVHNLSERRRRDRINEKLKSLQEMIPTCKRQRDTASMLDEAIEYTKSLQSQAKMMSMGCSMVPVMYPRMQPYMAGMGMGMGAGINMSMTQPMVPFPAMLPVPPSAMPNTAAASDMGPRFPIPGFLLPHDPSSTQLSSGQVPMVNPLIAHNAASPSMQNFINPYQQFLGLHQTQLALPQNQAVRLHDAETSTSKEVGNTETAEPDTK